MDRDLFGSDSDSDAEPRQQQHQLHQQRELLAEPTAMQEDLPKNSATARPTRDSEDNDEDVPTQQQPVSRRTGPPMVLEADLLAGPSSESIRLVKLSNIVDIESRAFDPEQYEKSEETYIDETGKRRVRLLDQTIRWRYKPAPDGSISRQSNARFVRWSDGSLQLLLGDEVLDVAEANITADHNYLFVRHEGLMQAQACLATKMGFRPASLSSKFHKRLTAAVDKRHTKEKRVRHVATVADPVRDKLEREKAEEARIRERETLARRQEREMSKYTSRGPGLGVSRAAELSASYLEAIEEEEPDLEDAGYTATERARASFLARGRRGVDEEAEAEAERRLATAKRETAPSRRPQPLKRHKGSELRGRQTVDDDEISGEDEGMQDFVVEDDEDDVQAQRQPARGRRGIVLSDDEDG